MKSVKSSKSRCYCLWQRRSLNSILWMPWTKMANVVRGVAIRILKHWAIFRVCYLSKFQCFVVMVDIERGNDAFFWCYTTWSAFVFCVRFCWLAAIAQLCNIYPGVHSRADVFGTFYSSFTTAAETILALHISLGSRPIQESLSILSFVTIAAATFWDSNKNKHVLRLVPNKYQI